MDQLIPALAITAGPVLILAPIVWALRSQGGRHAPGLVVKVSAGWNPYDGRVRRSIAHYAGKKRKPLRDTVPANRIVAAPIPVLSTDRDMTGAFPVVAVAA